MDLELITIPPTANTHTHTIIFLHGRGDSAKTFSESLVYSPDYQGRVLTGAFPSVRWVFPQTLMRPAARNPGHDPISQWFDIWNYNDFLDNEDLQAQGLRESVTSIRKVIEKEAALLGGSWDRIVLAGISQGASTAAHTLINLDIPASVNTDGTLKDRKLAAFLGFSCRLPFPGRTLQQMRDILSVQGTPHDDHVLRNTPVLLEHCVNDPLVPIESGRVLRDTLIGYGMDVVQREYPDGEHWFNSPQGIDEAMSFLEAKLGLTRIVVDRMDS